MYVYIYIHTHTHTHTSMDVHHTYLVLNVTIDADTDLIVVHQVSGTNLLLRGLCLYTAAVNVKTKSRNASNFDGHSTRNASSLSTGSESLIRAADSPVRASNDQLVCTMPPATWIYGNVNLTEESVFRHLPRSVNLSLQLYPQQRSSAGAFQYVRPLVISTVAPALGPVHGGYPLDVRGQHFVNHSDLSCRLTFEGSGVILPVVRAAWVSSSRISCIMPAGAANASGLLRLAVSNNRQNYDDWIGFSLYDIAAIEPSGGPDTGGTNVLIQLNSSVPTSTVVNGTCVFGDLSVPLFVSNITAVTSVTCVSPALFGVGSQLSVPFGVSLNGRDFISGKWRFVYYPEPRLNRLRPNSATSMGSSAITFIGENFLSSAHAGHGRVLCLFESRSLPALNPVPGGTPTNTGGAASKPDGGNGNLGGSTPPPLGGSIRRIVKEGVLRNGPRYRCYCPSLEEVYSDISDVQRLNASDYVLRVAISFNGQQYTSQDIDFFYYGVKKLIPR